MPREIINTFGDELLRENGVLFLSDEEGVRNRLNAEVGLTTHDAKTLLLTWVRETLAARHLLDAVHRKHRAPRAWDADWWHEFADSPDGVVVLLLETALTLVYEGNAMADALYDNIFTAQARKVLGDERWTVVLREELQRLADADIGHRIRNALAEREAEG